METIKNVLGMGHKDDSTSTNTTGHTDTAHTGHHTSTTAGHGTHETGEKTSNLTSRYGMNDAVAQPQDEGHTVVGGAYPTRHTADEYIPGGNVGRGAGGVGTGTTGGGKDIYGRGTYGDTFGERGAEVGLGGGQTGSTGVTGGTGGLSRGTEGEGVKHTSGQGLAGHQGGHDDHHALPKPTSGQVSDHPGGVPPQGLHGTGGHNTNIGSGVGVGIGPDGRGGVGGDFPTSGAHTTHASHGMQGTQGTHGTHGTHGNHGVRSVEEIGGAAPPLTKGDPSAQTHTGAGLNTSNQGLSSGHTSSHGPTRQNLPGSGSHGLTGGIASTHGSSGHNLQGGHSGLTGSTGAASQSGQQGIGSDIQGSRGVHATEGTHGTGPSLSERTRQGFEHEKKDLEYDVSGRYKE